MKLLLIVLLVTPYSMTGMYAERLEIIEGAAWWALYGAMFGIAIGGVIFYD